MRREIIVDSFAGGGGASLGIHMATGRSPDIGINHDPAAMALHAANHPDTEYHSKNIWKIDPIEAVRGREVGLLWASPDCKHFSKAKGGKPLKKNIRDLAWVVVMWAERVKPRVIILENVEEFIDWCPVDLDGKPLGKKGETFRKWFRKMRVLGYHGEYRLLRGCNYGAPTMRQRVFMIFRRDGEAIVWPRSTHGAPNDPAVVAGLKRPWRTAAEIIDFTLPSASIFLTETEGKAIGVRRPLAPATMARIAKGVDRYVLKAKRPFIVNLTHAGPERVEDVAEPMATVTCAHRGEKAVVVPTLIQTGYGERPGQDPRVPGLDKPLGTAVAGGGKHALVAAFLAQHNTDMVGHELRKPLSTIVGKGCTQAVVSAGLVNMHGGDRRSSETESPIPTLTAGGFHVAEVRAFLTSYFGTLQDPDLEEPLHTITTRDRFGLVLVEGQLYEIADIGMRMLTPRELFRAQGFPDTYIIDPLYNGKPLSKTAQIRMCGNSVNPQVAEALVRANYQGNAERVLEAAE